MATDQALDFSMKRRKFNHEIQPAHSSTTSNAKSTKTHNATKKEKSEQPSMAKCMSVAQSLAPIVYSPSTAIMGATLIPDPTLMPTTSLALSTLYRRRRRRYSNDEKEFHPKKHSGNPGNDKDEAYWERRRKNNQAAKRSRDARKIKEDEIALRAAFLEQENCKLKAEVAVLKNEMARLHCLLLNQMQP